MPHDRIQWTGRNAAEVLAFCGGRATLAGGNTINLEGRYPTTGDWIVRRPDGSLAIVWAEYLAVEMAAWTEDA